MKTVFKKGMKVYDQIVFPNNQGVITDIEDGNVYPLVVKVENSNLYYRLDGSFNIGTIPTLSTKPYKLEMQGFEQKAPAPTYEEALKEAHRKGDYYYLPDCLEVPSEELVDATIALLKLLFLRDYYNEGWQPDWKDNNIKYVIECYENELRVSTVFGTSRVMYFKSKDVTEKFLEEQKELLEIAKPLL
ncbi:hypothetical protein [Capnocytophaga sputigena]